MIFSVIANFCSKILPVPDGATWSDLEYLILISGIGFGFFQVFDGLILIVISKVKCAIMDTDSLFYTQLTLEEHPFEGISMHWCHEPSRLIGSDGDESDVESIWIFFSDFVSKHTISRISSEVDRVTIDFYEKSSPESLIAIRESSCGEVLCGKIGDFCVAFLTTSCLYFPPVHIDDIFHSTIFEVGFIPESSIDDGSITMIEVAQARDVHVIIVIV